MEKPDRDADAAEIAMWMMEDFETSVIDGLIEALEEKDGETDD